MARNTISVGTAQSDNDDEMLVAIHTTYGPITMGTNYARYFVTQLLLALEYVEKANKGGEDAQ